MHAPPEARQDAPQAFPVTLLALGGFASGSGMRLLDPLLPLVAHDLGVTVASTTALVAGFMLPYGLGQLGVGPLGDRLGKVRIACIALFLYGLALLASAVPAGLAVLVGWRALCGLFGGAVIPLLMAHIGDSVPYRDRQAAIGRFLTGMVMAQMVTGPISGVIGDHAGWRASFLVLGLLTIGVAALMALRLGPALWRRSDVARGRGQGLAAYVRLLSRPAGRWLLISGFFDGFCLFGGAFPFVGAFLIQGFGLSAAIAGLIVAGFGAGAFVYTRLARRLVRRFGERRLLLLGGCALAIGLIGLSLAPVWQAVLAIQFGLGLAFYMFHGVLQARATEVLPEARGTAVSAFAMALFLGQSAGSLSFGMVLALADYRAAFAAAAIGVLILALWSQAGLRRAA